MKKILLLFCFAAITSFGFSQVKVVTSGFTKIGNTGNAPAEQLEVDGNVLVQNNNYYNGKLASGVKTQMFGLDPFNNLVFNRSGIVANHPTALLFGIGPNRAMEVRSSSNNILMRVLEANGRMGIGTISPDQLLTVNGNASKPGGGPWATFSDKKLKKNVNDFEYGLETVLKISPVTYEYNGELNLPTNEEYVGIVAQDMAKVAPFMIEEAYVTDSLGNATDSYLSYDATALPYMLVNAVKEQQKLIDDQNQRIAQLEDFINTIGSAQNINNTNITLSAYDLAELDQNIPNPFTNSTSIDFTIPTDAQTAQIIVYGQNGQLMRSIDIDHVGKGTLNVNADDLPSGTYSYQLVVDGRNIQTNLMVVTK